MVLLSASASDISGTDGDDLLIAFHNGQEVDGGDGNDVLIGLGGSNLLKGGAGNDKLAGQGGDDLLTGGAGGDLFIFTSGHGTDTITDFAVGRDRIRLDIPDLNFADLDIRSRGSDARIDTGSGTIELTGLSPEDLTADDFLFF